MKLLLKARLQNTPGQLVSLLKPISSSGGNITDVKQEAVPQGEQGIAEVEFEASKEVLDAITLEISSSGIEIMDFGELRSNGSTDVLLIGDNIDTDIRDTIDRVNAAGGAFVSEAEVSMPDPAKESSARLRISGSPTGMRDALARLREVAKRKRLFLVEALE